MGTSLYFSFVYIIFRLGSLSIYWKMNEELRIFYIHNLEPIMLLCLTEAMWYFTLWWKALNDIGSSKFQIFRFSSKHTPLFYFQKRVTLSIKILCIFIQSIIIRQHDNCRFHWFFNKINIEWAKRSTIHQIECDLQE